MGALVSQELDTQRSRSFFQAVLTQLNGIRSGFPDAHPEGLPRIWALWYGHAPLTS